MTTDQTHVIVGAGLAGAKAAETLREEGFEDASCWSARRRRPLRAPAPVEGLPPR